MVQKFAFLIEYGYVLQRGHLDKLAPIDFVVHTGIPAGVYATVVAIPSLASGKRAEHWHGPRPAHRQRHRGLWTLFFGQISAHQSDNLIAVNKRQAPLPTQQK